MKNISKNKKEYSSWTKKSLIEKEAVIIIND